MKTMARALCFLVLLAGLAFAEPFDIFDYTVPQGWKKTPFQGGVMLSQQTKTSFGSIALYSSVPAGADAEQNFKGEWKRLITDALGISGEAEQIQEGPQNGDYRNLAGGTSASQDGMNYVVLLSSFSGNGRVASILYIATDEKLFDLFDSFNSALKLTKPKTVQAPPPQNPTANKPAANTNRTIATPTTNFDDGWVATIQNGFVRLAKGDVLVLLHYAVPLPDNMWVTGNEKERVLYYWNKLVTGRYQTSEVKVFENGVCYFCQYFGESPVTETATGASKYVGLYVNFDKSQGLAIQAIAPSFEVFHQYFPNIEALGKMAGYNKFAIKLSDLAGTWDESSGSFLQYYNTTTGAYAGMNAVSRANEFTFNRDGSYSSKHSGAMGFVGSQTFYSQNYKGKITLSDWKITLTNRFSDKTEAFNAYFEMTLGGPVLHLSQVGASSMTYDLMKK